MSTSTHQQTAAAGIATGRWRIDPTRSQVEFRTPTFWGLMIVSGRFATYDGTLDLGREPAVELTIEAASLDTNNKIRDEHLRSGDFFDVAHHPHVRFVSDDARLDGDRLTVRGRLHAAGRSMPLDVDASLQQADGELQIDATTEADHSALGTSHGVLGMIRTPSELTVRARLVPETE